MNQKSIATILILIATALGGPPAVDYVVNSPEIEVVIAGPDSAAVGELIELSIQGANPSWLLPTEDCRVQEGTVILSFRDAGEYEVLGTSIVSGRAKIAKHIIVVGGDSEPAPTPEPKPDVSELADQVAEWCAESNAPVAGCADLSRNFTEAAREAEDLEDLLNKVSAANRNTNQKGCERVLAQIQQHLFDNLQGESFEKHVKAFEDIGEGFRRYSNTDGTRGLWK